MSKKYVVVVSKDIENQKNKIPSYYRKRLKNIILSLEDNPYPSNSLFLKGSKNKYRIRIGDYRMIYSVNEEEITVVALRIGHRKDVYKKLF